MEASARAREPRLLQPDPAQEAVRQHARAVWRYLRVLGATAQQADDLTQEAFVVALDKGAERREAAAFAAFLRRTARHLWLQRHRGRREVLLADAVDLVWERDAGHDGGDELVEGVRRCVGELAERARCAVRMHYGEGCSRAEIARELGMQENGVKTLMQRARQAIRECLRRQRS